MIELVWRCILKKQLQKLLAITLGSMSAAILLAEATILPSGVDLSLFSILINSVKRTELLVQVATFIPLMYMCMCTYYSLFKIGMLTFYSFTPRQTSSVSLLMICSMVARYAAPVSYNFLNLIRLDTDDKTIFEQRMGNIDTAVPFFGNGFNKIYPLIMVTYTILIASNFFNRAVEYVGNWKMFRFQDEGDDIDGFDPSGIIILQKERSWLEQGHKVGELVIPLARSFHSSNMDLEFSNNGMVPGEKKASISLNEDQKKRLNDLEAEDRNHGSREGSNKSLVVISTQQIKGEIEVNSIEKETTTSASASWHVDGHSNTSARFSGLVTAWEVMKKGIRNLKSNKDANMFIPLSQDSTTHSRVPSSESLDEIFKRIQKPANYDSDNSGYDDHAMNATKPRQNR